MTLKSEAPAAIGDRGASGVASADQALSPATQHPNPTAAQRTHGRVNPSTAIYRLIAAEIDRQRRALGWSLARLDDEAGLNDGHASKLLNPDSPTGRQGTDFSLDLMVQAIERAGRPFRFADGAPAALGTGAPPPTDPNAHARMVRHWRHRKYFADLGRQGAQATAQKYSHKQRVAWGRKAAKRHSRVQRSEWGRLGAAKRWARKSKDPRK